MTTQINALNLIKSLIWIHVISTFWWCKYHMV